MTSEAVALQQKSNSLRINPTTHVASTLPLKSKVLAWPKREFQNLGGHNFYIQYNHKFLLICKTKKSGSIVGMDL